MRLSFFKFAKSMRRAIAQLSEVREDANPVIEPMMLSAIGGGIAGGAIGLGLEEAGELKNGIKTGVIAGATVGAGIGAFVAAPVRTLVCIGLFGAYKRTTSETPSENIQRNDCR